MDRPWAILCDLYYEWRLDQTNPWGASDEGLIHFPFLYRFPFGMGWNLSWYRDLADKTGISAEEGLIQVSPHKRIPASYHSYTDELDSIRKITEGAVALNENIAKVENYKDLQFKEMTCLEWCKAKPNEDEIREEVRLCQERCIVPRSLLHEDINAKLENWRTQAVKCLAEHSAEIGDGDSKKFSQCLNTFTDQLIQYGTKKDNLNAWIKNYSKYFRLENFQKEGKKD